MNLPLSSATPTTIPITQKLIMMMTVFFEGEEAALETNLANLTILGLSFKVSIDLRYQEKLGVAESRDEFYFGITIRQEVQHSIHPGIQQRQKLH
jgi:hypothetical protein